MRPGRGGALSAAALPEVRGAPGRCGRSGRADNGVSERRQGSGAAAPGCGMHRHQCLGRGSRRLHRVGTSAGFTVVYAVGTEPPQDGYSRVPMCTSRSASSRNQTSGMAGPTSRQGRLTASEARMRNHSGSAHSAVAGTEAGRHYAGAPVAGLKTRPSRHIACITTASLRARATAARLKPTFSFSFRPQLRRALSERTRVSITVAAS